MVIVAGIPALIIKVAIMDLFVDLYQKAFPLVARYVHKQGGSFEEAKDIFQDALVIWYEKKPELVYSEKAYILGIARHLWSKRHNGTQSLKEDIAMEDEPQTSSERLLTLLQSSGQKCMELLRAFYYDKLSLDKVAERFGFSGVRSATVQKYKCLEKVRETVKEKSLTYEDFLE